MPLLMELLEDADGMVRDAAKSTVIELFKYESSRPYHFAFILLTTDIGPHPTQQSLI